ncbi:MAG: hypothetical protein HC906_15115 [Bacteroidales bacterium]|nr:hypothetical protein [Bacteroidales bacterium]
MYVTNPRLTDTVGKVYTYVVNAVDPDEDDNLVFNCIQKPDWLSYISSTRILFGTPKETDLGKNEVIFTVSDGKIIVTQKFNIVVLATSSVFDFKSDQLNMYPIPVSDVLYVQTENPDFNGSVNIYDLQGKLVITNNIECMNGLITVKYLN